MAKTTPHLEVPLIKFGRLMRVMKLNSSRMSGDLGSEAEKKALVNSLAQDCWDITNTNGLVLAAHVKDTWIIDGVEVPLESFLPAEMEKRKAEWEAAAKQAATDPKKGEPALEAFETLYVETVKNKKAIIVPDVFQVTGHRRGELYLTAMIQRVSTPEPDFLDDMETVKNPKAGEKRTISDLVPVSFGDYRDEAFRMEEQSRENQSKLKGNKQPSEVDDLMFAKKMVAMGKHQEMLRQHFSSPGQGVKYFRILSFNSRFPKLRIFERCCLPAKTGEKTTPGYIPIVSVRYPSLQKMWRRLPENIGKGPVQKGKADPNKEIPLTEEEVRDYFADPKKKPTGEPVQEKGLDRKQQEAIVMGNDNPITKAAIQAVMSREIEGLKKFEKLTECTYALLTLVDSNDVPPAEAILKKFAGTEAGKKRQALFAAVLKTLEISL